MTTERLVFDAQLLLHANGEQFVREIRAIFNNLETEARRLISQGSQTAAAGVSPLYTAGLGQAQAFIGGKPGLSQRQQEQAYAAVRRAEQTYGVLQRETPGIGNLGNLTTAQQRGAALLQGALQEQSNAKLREAKAAEVLAAAELKAARQVELDSGRASAARKQQAAASSKYTVGGVEGGLTPAQVAALNKRLGAAFPPTPPPTLLQPTPAQIAAATASRIPPSPGARGGTGFGFPFSPNAAQQAAINSTVTTAMQTQALRIQTHTAQMQSGNAAWLRAQAQATLAERQRAIAVAEATKAERIAQGGGRGGIFQNLQYAIHQRQGGVTDSRLPEDFRGFGSFVASKAITTAGFALTGAALFGAVSGFKELIREASELQRQLAIVRSAFDATGDSEGFHHFSEEVVQIANRTGVAADQVALVARQLAGVFRDAESGAQDFNRALQQTEVALKLSQVTGLPLQEITDSLTSISVSFGDNFEKIGDTAVGLEQKFGVLSTEIIRFTADLAPTGKELGFTSDQLATLGAIAQQASGRAGSALAENFGRILPTIRDNAAALVELLSQSPSTSKFIEPLVEAINQGNIPVALKNIVQAYGELNAAQKNQLATLLGGARQAQAFFAVLNRGSDVIAALDGTVTASDFTGKLDDRFQRFTQTVDFAFQETRRIFEQFGLALFESGIGDFLKDIAGSGLIVANVFLRIVEVFGALNEATHGLAGQLVAVALAMKLISSLYSALRGAGSLIKGGLQGPAAGQQLAAGAINTGLTGGLGSAAVPPSPNMAQARVFGRTYGGKVGSGLNLMAGIVIASAVLELFSAAQGVAAQLSQARNDIRGKVDEALKKPGATSASVAASIPHEAFGSATQYGRGADIALKTLSLGIVDTTSPGDVALDKIQQSNAPQQIEELKAIAGVLQGKAKERVETLLKMFEKDPANNALNDAVAQTIDSARKNMEEARVALEKIASQSGTDKQQQAAAKGAAELAPQLEQLKAQVDAGEIGPSAYVDALDRLIALEKGAIEGQTNPDASIVKAIQGHVSERDQILSAATRRIADVNVKLASLRGANVATATYESALTRLQSLIEQKASPSTQLDAALDVLSAQQQKLEEFINSPVVTNGIARAPTAAEKLARAAQGIEISPEVREAVLRGTLVLNKATEIYNVAQASGTDQTVVIDAVIKLIQEADRTGIDALGIAIDSRIKNLQRELVNLEPDDKDTRTKVLAALAALQQARAALGGLQTGAEDPGAKVYKDTTDLSNQTAIEASDEARALAEALIAQQRARANGDPVALAEAAVAAAQLALQYASKPSETAAALAQLIEAQNQLADANAAVLDAQSGYTETVSHDPVTKAQAALDRARRAVENAHGEAARLQALAAQVQAEESLAAAISSVLDARSALLEAIATASGDAVAAAKLRLDVDRRHLDELIQRDRGTGDDPNNDPEVIRQKAQIVADQASVRDAELQSKSSAIDTALQLERITTQQAIAQFEALLQIPNLTKEQTDQILLKIKQLKGELNNDLQWDVPSEIKLPTIYQVKRLIEAQNTPTGPSTYQDNRSYSLFQGAVIGSDVDMQSAVNAISDLIGAPPRNGQRISPTQ